MFLPPIFPLVRDEDGKITMEELRQARKHFFVPIVSISISIISISISIGIFIIIILNQHFQWKFVTITKHRWWQAWERNLFLNKSSKNLQRSSSTSPFIFIEIYPFFAIYLHIYLNKSFKHLQGRHLPSLFIFIKIYPFLSSNFKFICTWVLSIRKGRHLPSLFIFIEIYPFFVI